MIICSSKDVLAVVKWMVKILLAQIMMVCF